MVTSDNRQIDESTTKHALGAACPSRPPFLVMLTASIQTNAGRPPLHFCHLFPMPSSTFLPNDPLFSNSADRMSKGKAHFFFLSSQQKFDFFLVVASVCYRRALLGLSLPAGLQSNARKEWEQVHTESQGRAFPLGHLAPTRCAWVPHTFIEHGRHSRYI